MRTETSLVAEQVRLQQWADLIKDSIQVNPETRKGISYWSGWEVSNIRYPFASIHTNCYSDFYLCLFYWNCNPKNTVC